ncbi:MAG: hypothetical protein ISQ14_14435 [Verrucomicrobiae bacterium]|jgi:hypothetical protein|nr:hypothetical protein [Verrucomicrobiae bacterium]
MSSMIIHPSKGSVPIRVPLAAVIILFHSAVAPALEGVPQKESDPAGLVSTPPKGQKEIAGVFAAKCIGSRIVTDKAGNVVKLALSRHGWKEGIKMPPGVSDAGFGAILKLPKLEAVFIEKMPLSDESYALLGQIRSLKDVRIHYPTLAKPLPNSAPHQVTDRFARFLNQLPGLRVLQLKHIFGMRGDGMAGLAPQSELEHLELDTVCAKASAVPFVVAATKLRNLQVHRCEWTDADLQRVLGALPQLEVLELKPNKMPRDPIAGRSLRGLANCPKLKLLQLTGRWADLAWDGGLDVLEKLPALRQVNFVGFKDLTAESEAVQRLHKARPDLLIKVGVRILGGKPGQKPLGVDDGYDWGGSVTTHG